MNDLPISIIQTSLHWEDRSANLDMLQKKIKIVTEDSRLIVLPEMFSTGFSMDKESLAETMDGPTVEWMKKAAAEKRAIITGSIIAREDLNGITNYYNRLLWVLPNGEYGFYDKRHLFAYGKEDLHFSAGKSRLLAQVNGWKVNLQICYDLRFPVWLRQSNPAGPEEKPEYDLLIVVANWPAARSGAFFVRYYVMIWRRPALPVASDVCYDALAQPTLPLWLGCVTREQTGPARSWQRGLFLPV